MVRRTAMICLLAVLSTTLVFAQGRQRREGMGGPPPDPATMVERRVSHLSEALNLTDDQKTKATAIFTAAITNEQSIRTTMRTAHESLAAAVKKNDTATIDQVAAVIGTATTQTVATQAKAEAAFYAILTPDQQAKYDSMPHHGPGRMGPMGGRMGPPPQDH